MTLISATIESLNHEARAGESESGIKVIHLRQGYCGRRNSKIVIIIINYMSIGNHAHKLIDFSNKPRQRAEDLKQGNVLPMQTRKHNEPCSGRNTNG